MLSPQRKGRIGSSQIAAVFNHHPHLTRLMLYAHFHDGMPLDVEENERMTWGRRLQSLILEDAARLRRWEIIENTPDRYVTHPEPRLRTGATIDAKVRDPDRGVGVMEVKTVDYQIARDWPEGTFPQHYWLQALHQCWVLREAGEDCDFVALAVLRLGNTELLPIQIAEWKPEYAEMFDTGLMAFWRQVAEGKPPAVTDPVKDTRALESLYPERNPDLVMTSDEQELIQAMADYAQASTRATIYKKEAERLKAEILAAAADCGQIQTPAGFARLNTYDVHRQPGVTDDLADALDDLCFGHIEVGTLAEVKRAWLDWHVQARQSHKVTKINVTMDATYQGAENDNDAQHPLEGG